MIQSLVLIDGHALAYRMYFALENTRMSTSKKVPTWAVYGFINALFAMLRDVKPDGVAISFDKGKITFRNEIYPEYKANRDDMPDELRQQMGIILEAVEKFGIPIYQLDNYEADDVIGTLARQAVESKQVNQVLILTGDQDAFQLVDLDGEVKVLIPSRKPKEGLIWYDTEGVVKKWGIPPEQVIDYKALRGDTSDNIPGIPGVGEKTAVKLLTQYPTLDAIYADLDNIKPDGLKKKLTEHKDKAYLSQKLATIDRNVPMELKVEDCRLAIPHVEELLHFLQEYEFKTFIQQAPQLLAPFLNGDGDHAELASARTNLANGSSKQSAPSNGSTGGGSATQMALLEKPETKLAQAEKLVAAAQSFQVDHRCITTENQLKEWVAQIQEAGVFALDVETTGLDVFTTCPVGISMSMSPGRFQVEPRDAVNILKLSEYPQSFETVTVADGEAPIHTVYVPLGHVDPDSGELLPDQLLYKTVMDHLGPVLQDPKVVKVVHNAKYELNVFRQWGCGWKGLVFDTMVASYVTNPDRRHGLKALSFSEFGWTMTEITQLIGTGKKQILFSQVPLEPAAAYAACDAYVTLSLASKFIQELDEGLATLFYEVELPLCYVLADMEYEGVALNTSHLDHLREKLDTRLKELEETIYGLAGEEFNLNSPKQVGEILFEKLGIPPVKKTAKKTGYSTDAKVLEQLADEYEIVEHLLEYRQYFKLKSTYVDTLPEIRNEVTHRVHTSFNQTVTATGRLSSSEPNLQNIPIRTEIGRSIREAFVPRDMENRVLLSADYSQIELRLLAHFSEDPHLLEAFRSGKDIHAATAALVFDIPLEEVTKEQRYKAKAVNFGIIYGQTAHGLSQQLGISRAEAQDFIDRYFFTYSRVRQCIEGIKAEAHQTGRVSTIAGRIRDLSDGLNSKNRNIREFSERAAFNTPLQGSAADLMKVAMIRLYRKLKAEQVDARMILQVHDELVLDVPKSELEKVQRWVEWAMALDQPLHVPLVIDVYVGPTWMESEGT